MTVSEILQKMIVFSDGNIHDINHLEKVYVNAITICDLEGVDEQTKKITAIAAIVHDIACPLCRKKYGNTNGPHQEKEGEPLTRSFLSNTGLSDSEMNRIAYLVAHHHTPSLVDGIDYQILLEADFLVNADESNMSQESIKNVYNSVFRTESGKALLRTIYLCE